MRKRIGFWFDPQKNWQEMDRIAKGLPWRSRNSIIIGLPLKETGSQGGDADQDTPDSASFFPTTLWDWNRLSKPPWIILTIYS